MVENTRNIIVFYDAPCIDGAGAAWCFNKKYGEDTNVNLELVPLPHGAPAIREQTILSNVSNGGDVYFVDTSPKDSELTKLLSVNGTSKVNVQSVTIWDHHITELERLQNFQSSYISDGNSPDLEVDIDVEMPSAALMVWEKLFVEEPPPELLKWIGKMEPPVTLSTNQNYAIAAFIDSRPIKTPVELVNTFNELVAMSTGDMLNKGNSILADQHNNTDKMRDTTMFTHLQLLPDVEKIWMPLVNANVQNFGRRINEALIDEGSKGTTAGVSGAWFAQGDGSVKLSLRTEGTPDAGKISQYLGSTIGVDGGGHATDAVVQFKDLQQFVQNVPLYTKAQMKALQWEPKTSLDLG